SAAYRRTELSGLIARGLFRPRLEIKDSVMPNSRDSLRSAGNNGLKGRMARVWPTSVTGSRVTVVIKNNVIVAIATISTPAAAMISPNRLLVEAGVAPDGDAALLSTAFDATSSDRPRLLT